MGRGSSTKDSRKEAWFEYSRSAGRMTAIPVHWKGWVALAILSIGPGAIALAVSVWAPWFRVEHGPLMVIALLAATFTTVFLLLKTRGRPRRPSPPSD